MFEPQDGLRYGHKFWADATTGLLLKARIIDERGEVVEQFAFTDLAIGAQVDRDDGEAILAPGAARTGRSSQPRHGRRRMQDTGWTVNSCRPGSTRSSRATGGCGASRDRSRTSCIRTAWSRSRCSSSRSAAPQRPIGPSQQGGINVYIRQFDDHLVTVLGEAPAADGPADRQLGGADADAQAAPGRIASSVVPPQEADPP